jgi:iron complex outermembrane receptor protein
MRAFWLGPVAFLAVAPAAAQVPLPVLPGAFPSHPIEGRALAQRGWPEALVPAGAVPGLLAPRVPGLGRTAWSLRGLGNGLGPAPLDSAVGVTVDGVPLGDSDGADFALFDLQGVAVTAGGWGVEGSAGTMRLSLAAPDREGFSGWIGGAWGVHDRKMARGGVNVPLGVLTLNASAYVADDDGDARNQLTEEPLNDADRAGLRLAARLDATERLSLTVAAAHVEDKGENILAFACNPLEPADCGGRSSTTGLTKARILGGGPQFGLPVSGDKAGQRLGRLHATTLLTARLGWEGEGLRAELLSSLRDGSEASGIDYADGRGLPTAALPDPPVRGFVDGGLTLLTDRKQREMVQRLELSADLPFGGLTFGGRYLDGSDRLDMADLLTAENGTAAGEPRLLADRIARTDRRQLVADARLHAAFGALRLEGGLAYVDEEQRLALSETACGPAGCLSALLGGAVPQRQQWSGWMPTVSAEVALGEAARLFAGARRGWRAGGWNLRAVTPGAFTAFAPETAWTFEGGGAVRLLEGRLDARATVFAIDADDRQGSGSATVDGVPQLTAATLGDWRNRGVELVLAARPLPPLALHLNLTAQDARWRDGGPAGAPAHAPDLIIGGGGSWELAIPASGIFLTPGFDLQWVSRTTLDDFAQTPGPGGRLRADGFVAIETDDRAWLLTLACRNCTNGDAPEGALFGWRYLELQRAWTFAAVRRF